MRFKIFAKQERRSTNVERFLLLNAEKEIMILILVWVKYQEEVKKMADDSIIREMKIAANAYARAYRILSEKIPNLRGEVGKVYQINDAELMFPSDILLALACEVYLKLIILERGLTFRREHDLLSLFNILDEDTRTEIINKCRDVNGNRNDFLTKLEGNKDVFLKWRYFYEIDLEREPECYYVVDTPFLNDLLISLEQTIS